MTKEEIRTKALEAAVKANGDFHKKSNHTLPNDIETTVKWVVNSAKIFENYILTGKEPN